MACLAPNKLADGTEVACRECKLCQLKIRNDWVGRNIAESKTSKFCYVITATYGRGRVGEILHERAVILTYSDCQKFLKLLRRHGYVVRLFITGEYGSERGRAHWNIILYSDEPLPPFSGWDQHGNWVKKARFKQRFNWCRVDSRGDLVKLQSGEDATWWPHGFVHIDEVNVPSVQYVCKYVLKDLDANGKQGHKGQSKDPPLGTKYFRQLAAKYVDQRLAPQTPEYRFPEARTKDGQPIIYWLKGRALELFLEHYLFEWRRRNGDQPYPRSQMLELFEQYGRVVNDEEKMLERRDNPSGRAFQPALTAAQTRAAIERNAYERAVEHYGHVNDAMDLTEMEWIEGAPDVEEGQRRQQRYDRERRERWYALNHQYQRHWYQGHGWRVRTDDAGPCGCCDLSTDTVRAEPGASPSGRGGERPADRPDYGLGKVGRYNRDYGTSGGGPGDKSEAR